MARSSHGVPIVFADVSVDREGKRVLRDIDLTIEAGELLVLVGPSGGGKSTLLKSINRLLAPANGKIMIGDRDAAVVPITELRRMVGYCFQALGLFPHMTVAENIGIGLRLANEERSAIEKRVHELLERVSLPWEFGARFPGTLSGGQAQRVAVARALATKPRVLLLDEPFGALDPETRASVQEELLAICAEEGPTTVLVSHDLGEALKLGERIAVLYGGELLRVDTPSDLLKKPGDPRIDALLAPAKNSAHMITKLLHS